ncbi:DUF1120 domain-containing protein [Pseudomonas synxantha]|uniref:DUF1120 domain-containing protein n=1 Tax=Pseudomonas synxantha TaxID=47883 RepID=UPI00099B8735|nr:DUF1120 domain-containing protein [Pseudomonas synxantha]OPB05926.1 hypothetical protein BFW89_09935 [Pseudomonas synxantha]
MWRLFTFLVNSIRIFWLVEESGSRKFLWEISMLFLGWIVFFIYCFFCLIALSFLLVWRGGCMNYMENFMRNKKGALFGALLMSCAGGVFADAKLSIKGTIVPASCVPSFASSVVDFGSLSFPDRGKADRYYIVPPQTVGFSVSCSGKVAVAISFEDLRKGSVFDGGAGFGYGLGKQGEHNIGYYLIKPKNLTVDGDAAKLLTSNDGVAWRSDQVYAHSTEMFSFVVSAGGGEPGQYQDYAGDLDFMPFVAFAGVDLTKKLELDGAVVMHVKYI